MFGDVFAEESRNEHMGQGRRGEIDQLVNGRLLWFSLALRGTVPQSGSSWEDGV